MPFLPTSLGTRPRLAVEIRPEGVVAARAEDAAAIVTAVAHAELADGAVTPGPKAGNLVARNTVVAAVKKSLEAVALKERGTTLVLPDTAVRVLLLDFDDLPAKAAEALPVVRFRLKKLLPFEVDDAVVSYQVMSTGRSGMRVLAAAVPKDVLAEYESVVREAGFEPGAVLPSTLAACAGMAETDGATLLVNAGENSVTTAIVQGGVLLLHRTVDLAAEGLEEKIEAAAIREVPEVPPELLALPLVDRASSAGEWARQEPLNGYGMVDEELAPISADAVLKAEMLAERIKAEADEEAAAQARRFAAAGGGQRLSSAAREVTQAVSVAAAYFEDTLQTAPGVVLTAGTLGAEVLGGLLRDAGFGSDEMRVKEMVEASMLAGGAVSARVPKGWMAGVRGALRS